MPTLPPGVYQYGRSITWTGVFLGTLISLGLILVGVYLLSQPRPRTMSVIATVGQGSNCITSGTNYTCALNLTYTINGTTYTNQLNTTSSTPYTPGSTIPVTVNATNPQVIVTTTPSRWYLTVGWIFLILGIIILLISWLSLLVVRTTNFYVVSGQPVTNTPTQAGLIAP
jgi:hypothetical protein